MQSDDRHSRIVQRVRRDRIKTRIRHGIEPLLVLALHAAVIFLIWLAADKAIRSRDAQQIEVTVVEMDVQELDLLESELEQQNEQDPEDFDFAIPEPEQFEAAMTPQVEEFTAIAPVESPIILSGVSLLDSSLSEAQMKRGSGSLFGFNECARGDLIGTMYDLKRNAAGQARAVDFTRDLKGLVDARFSRKALKEFRRISKPLYLSHLLQPYIPAEQGPEAFGVGKQMEPRQWIVHYTGQFQCMMAGRYRFVGEFDDVLLVFVNGELVLEAGWGEPVSDWRPREHVGAHMCYTTHPLVYGDWIELLPLRPTRIDIVIGENPGGWMGGVLLVEQEGRNYHTDASGRNVLPLFALQPLMEQEEASLRQFPGFSIEERTPVMGIRSDMALLNQAEPRDDEVKVIVE